MRARRFARAFVPAVVVTFLSVPSAVLAQDAEISGVVTDNTGGILPGVTVEASSPALIEQSRVVFTDSQGRTASSRSIPATTRSRSACPASPR